LAKKSGQIEMKKYNVRWLEEHEAVVDAESEDTARVEAHEYAQTHGTEQDTYNFRIVEEKE
jgi:hypothetical protein